MIKNVTKLIGKSAKNAGEGIVRNVKNETMEYLYGSTENANLLGDIKIQYSFARRLFNPPKTV